LDGEVVHEGDEEVARSHGRVADFQFEDALGGVEDSQLAQTVWFGLTALGQFLSLGMEGVHVLFDEGAYGLLNDEFNERLACSNCQNPGVRTDWGGW
jgi:hypothetical protein